MQTLDPAPRVAVVIPCFNEAAAIAGVVAAFRSALPDAEVVVFDNASTDGTLQVAREAGARVQSVQLRGKGNVMRRLFADVDADIYLMVDGDGTYEAAAAPRMVQALVDGNHDVVVGVRRAQSSAAYRSGHAFGNRVLTLFLGRLFGRECNDILSGYRALSRRFVKSFPVLADGFEIETELTVHALELKLSMAEVETRYGTRGADSHSKLNTWRDGARILATMLRLFSAERPVLFYGLISLALASASLVLAAPLVITWLQTGLVPRFPTAILSTGLMILASLSLLAGAVLDNVTRGRREARMLAYLRESDPATRLAGRH